MTTEQATVTSPDTQTPASFYADPEYPTCCQCNATGPQQFGWFRFSDGRALCGECRYPLPAGACADCRGAGRYTIGGQTDGLTGDAIAYACPTCRGSGKGARLDTPELLAEMAADEAAYIEGGDLLDLADDLRYGAYTPSAEDLRWQTERAESQRTTDPRIRRYRAQQVAAAMVRRPWVEAI